MEEDESGLTFQKWTPDVDKSRIPVSMMINFIELRVTGFKLNDVLPQTLEGLHVDTWFAHVRNRIVKSSGYGV